METAISDVSDEIKNNLDFWNIGEESLFAIDFKEAIIAPMILFKIHIS